MTKLEHFPCVGRVGTHVPFGDVCLRDFVKKWSAASSEGPEGF
jgi:hypothetical protein